MKFYVITDDENGMKITWKNVSMRFSHSEALFTCGLSLGTLFCLQPLFNSRKGPRATLGVWLAQTAEHKPYFQLPLEPPPSSFIFCALYFLLPPFHSLSPELKGTLTLHPLI